MSWEGQKYTRSGADHLKVKDDAGMRIPRGKLFNSLQLDV